MILPVCVKPYDDELLYGWLLRLARENGMESMQHFQNYYIPQMDIETSVAHAKIRLDYVFGLDDLCKKYDDTKLFPKAAFILDRMTPLHAIFPFMRYGYQAEISQMILRTRTGGPLDIVPKNSHVEDLQICPECMEEDRKRYGEAYYHTWHHLAGVRVCAKHKCLLKRIRHNGREFLEKLDALFVQEISQGIFMGPDLKLALLQKKIWDCPPFVSLQTMKQVILERIREAGYKTQYPYGTLADDMQRAGFSTLFRHSIEKSLKMVAKSPQVSVVEYAALAAFLYPDRDIFMKRLLMSHNESEPELKEMLEEQFEIISSFGPEIQLKCRICGYMFYMHPYAVKLGCTCPLCSSKNNPETVINRQLSCLGDGLYELVGKFEGYGNRDSRILHKKCGKVRKMRPADAIWMEDECSCMYRPNIQAAQKQIDSERKHFRVVRIVDARSRLVEIQHTECGQSFQIAMGNFQRFPYCRCCRNRKYTNEKFRQELEELTGDQYEIESPFIDQMTPVSIRHKRCGTVTTARVAEFLNGRRCGLCTPIIRSDELPGIVEECTGGNSRIVSYESGLYTVDCGDGNTVEKDSRYIMQELTRPTPSNLFPVRIREPVLKARAASDIYMDILEAGRKGNRWRIKDAVAAGYERNTAKNAVKFLLKNGYIEKTEYGRYTIKPAE